MLVPHNTKDEGIYFQCHEARVGRYTGSCVHRSGLSCLLHHDTDTALPSSVPIICICGTHPHVAISSRNHPCGLAVPEMCDLFTSRLVPLFLRVSWCAPEKVSPQDRPSSSDSKTRLKFCHVALPTASKSVCQNPWPRRIVSAQESSLTQISL